MPLSLLQEGPYGFTAGINYKLTPPVPTSSYMPAQQLTWAKADGVTNFRGQVDVQFIWVNATDLPNSPSNLYWDVLDDMVNKANQAGLTYTYPLRGFPSFALQTSAYQATDEPHYMPDPAYVWLFLQACLNRYNGVYNIPGYGPLSIQKYEILNEEGNSYFTSSSTRYTLAQAVNNGTPYSVININAAATAIGTGIHLQFGTSGGAGQTVVTTAPVNIGDTSIHISAVGGGTFTANQTYNNGSNWTIVYYGLNAETYAMYDGTSGVVANGSPPAQPARSPRRMKAILDYIGPRYQASYPTARIGMGAVWWMDDRNMTDFIAGLGEALQYIQWMNVHLYSNAQNPANPLLTGGTIHVPSTSTAITNMAASALAAGFPNLQIEVTEFGWQAFVAEGTSTTTVAPGSVTVTCSAGFLATSGIATGKAIRCESDTGNQEDVTITALNVGSNQFTGTFAKSHSGTWAVGFNGDCSKAAQSNRLQGLVDTCRTSGHVRRVYVYTYSSATTVLDQSSLTLWNGSTYVDQPARATWKNYIAQYPLWSIISTLFPTATRRDGTLPATKRRDGTLPGTKRRDGLLPLTDRRGS